MSDATSERVASVDDLLDSAPCGFLSFTDDGTVALVNATLLRTLGYERAELIGKHVEKLFTVGGRIFYHTHWFPLLRLHGRAEEIFLLLRSKSGEDIGMLVNAVRRERPEQVSYDCVLMEVRERQKYEEELLRARRVADQARAEIEVQSTALRQANDQLETQALELELQQQQLQEQTIELEEAGEELRVINEHLMARTEEAEQLRDAAEAANQAKSSFLAVMSHELRTPLNAIAGYVQLLEMGIHGPVTEAQLEALGRVSRSQRHLLSLINDVLDLSRIEAGHVEYHIEEVSVEEMVAAVLPMIEPQLAAKGLVLQLQLGTDLNARADREKVQQIILNLLGNAVKFTPAGGVTVSAHRSEEPPNRILVRVQDTGLGIPREKLESIFEPFVQVQERQRRGIEGSGLGLAISRDLARGMGGDVTAESAVGEGSTFSLVMPAA